MLELAALVVLGPDIGEGDARVPDSHDFLHVDGAHHAELPEHVRFAVHVRPAVDQHEAAPVARHNRRERDALDAADALDDQRGAHHQGAAVSP